MSREAFEKWAQGKSLLINIRQEMMYTAGYINVKEMAWEAWQAALQHPQPAVPDGWIKVMRGMAEYAECNDPRNPYLQQAQALLSADKED